MVKKEDCYDENCLDDKSLVSKVQSFIQDPHAEDERSLPGSSSGPLKSYFVGMGFSPTLVEKVIGENGEADVELLLETLFTYSALEKSHFEDSGSPNELPFLVKQEDDSSLDLTSDDEKDSKSYQHELNDILRTRRDVHATTFYSHTVLVMYAYQNSASSQPRYLKYEPNVCLDKKSQLLIMKFSEEEVDFAINRLGEAAALDELIDFIIAAQVAGYSGNKEAMAEKLFGTMDRTVCLLQMGFTEGEISTAMERLGEDAPLTTLADSITTSRRLKELVKQEEIPMDDGCENKMQNQNGGDSRANPQFETSRNHYASLERRTNKQEPYDGGFDDTEEMKRAKKAKYPAVSDKMSSCSSHSYAGDPYFGNDFVDPEETKPVKEELINSITPNFSGNAWGFLSKAPYFFYGNVANVPQTTWRKLSQFLYGTDPEFALTENFSALRRKEGYIHNLPHSRRFNILPKAPMTIWDALPHTRNCWPSWDERKKLNGISCDTTGVTQVCERLEGIVRGSQGILSEENKQEILHQSRKSNLLWVGPNKLNPTEPEHVERILGYPVRHTELWGLEAADRLRLLKYSFQTDTLGYYLSVLRSMYPNGLKVLSIYTGTGGALVSLHKLEIHMRCVVSIESDQNCQRLLSRWWQTTRQAGELEQIDGIEKLTTQKMESLYRQFGSFDLVIGSNPGTYVSNYVAEDLSGMDMTLFFEFVRVFQRVRSIAGKGRR